MYSYLIFAWQLAHCYCNPFDVHFPPESYRKRLMISEFRSSARRYCVDSWRLPTAQRNVTSSSTHNDSFLGHFWHSVIFHGTPNPQLHCFENLKFCKLCDSSEHKMAWHDYLHKLSSFRRDYDDVTSRQSARIHVRVDQRLFFFFFFCSLSGAFANIWLRQRDHSHWKLSCIMTETAKQKHNVKHSWSQI